MRKKFILAEPKINLDNANNLLKRVVKSNYFNENKYTKILEKKFSHLLKVKYVVATTSGTISIFLALKASGIKYGDQVIIPNITFPATANAVRLAGAIPVVVDVDKKNLLIDTKKLKKKINNKTKAIIPVHISGRGNNIKSILRIAKKKGIRVIEDAAEALMSKVHKKFLGTFGDIGCFSFAPNKILTTGQGGIIVTNSKEIYKKLYQLKDQGRSKIIQGGEDDYKVVGYNFKFTELQAALGLSQLSEIFKRKKTLINHYKVYKKYLPNNKYFRLIGFDLKSGELPLWTDVYCKDRNKLYKFLCKKKIFCRFFWKPLHSLRQYKQNAKFFPNSSELKNKLLWLPSSLHLKKKDIIKICNEINRYYNKNNLKLI